MNGDTEIKVGDRVRTKHNQEYGVVVKIVATKDHELDGIVIAPMKSWFCIARCNVEKV
jgi:formylmethanofuran dehydrogenase subunit D